jgi:nucleotide-binding universal stress UspA family protein
MAVSEAPAPDRGRVAPPAARPADLGRVLVPLDGSERALTALPPAAQLARAAGVDVILMTAARPAHAPGVEEDLALQLGETDALFLLTGAASASALSGLPVTRLVVKGEAAAPPAEAILAAARDVGAGLIVMATHGRSGVRRAILGSVADAVVAQAAAPVLLVPPHAPAPSGDRPVAGTARLLVALDGSAASEAALGTAAAASAALGAPIDLVRVVAGGGASGANAALESVELRLHRAGVPCRRLRTAVLEARGRSVAETLLAYAEQSDARMLILATHARRGLDRLVHGSVAAELLARAAVPVMLVRPPAVPEAEAPAAGP